MAKSTFFTGQPVISQLFRLVPRNLVSSLSRQHKANRYYKKFDSYQHVVTMLFACLTQCTSLRELVTGLQANSTRLQHLGMNYMPRRSTLSDANRRRPEAFFAALFHALAKRLFPGSLPDSPKAKSYWGKLLLIDSTTITLFSSVLKAAGRPCTNGRKKGGAKAHVAYSPKHDVPVLVRLTASATNDKAFINGLALPKGTIVVMDKGYLSYKQYDRWDKAGVSWVTRLSSWSVVEVLETHKVSKEQWEAGVRADQTIKLGRAYKGRNTPQLTVRMVTYYDAEKDREFQFITSMFDCPPSDIALLYKHRWLIELFFKRLKQNYPLRHFLGDNENAIKIQLWCALIADLIIKAIKDMADHGRTKKWAFSNVCGLVRLHLNTYIDIVAFLKAPEKALIGYVPPDHGAGPGQLELALK